MANTTIEPNSPEMFVWDGNSWVLNDNYPVTISLRTMMELEDPNYQEAIVDILISSFTDPKHIAKFIDQLSPTEELRALRTTIWQILR